MYSRCHIAELNVESIGAVAYRVLLYHSAGGVAHDYLSVQIPPMKGSLNGEIRRIYCSISKDLHFRFVLSNERGACYFVGV